MKHLFISDLDGTLLNKNIEVTEYTVDTLNQLIDGGMLFSVATARTAASVSWILKDIHLQCPVVLMNGAMVYDMQEKKYLKVAYIGNEQVKFVADTLKKHGLTGFAYGISDNQLVTYYERLETKGEEDFYNERVEKYHKKFTQTEDFAGLTDHGIAYFCLMAQKDRLDPLYQELKQDEKLNFSYYQDIYSTNLWYLEISSCEASKYTSAMYVRQYIGADYMTGFGDNLNDLPLFEACEEKIAVKNAKDELKAVADKIISENTEDGVARYLNEIYA